MWEAQATQGVELLARYEKSSMHYYAATRPLAMQILVVRSQFLLDGIPSSSPNGPAYSDPSAFQKNAPPEGLVECLSGTDCGPVA